MNFVAEMRRKAESAEMKEPDPYLNQLSERVIGAVIEVHRDLGAGREERVYENAIEHEFQLRGISYERQPLVDIFYKGVFVGKERFDFWIERKLVLELKAVEKVLDLHKAQLRSYLKTTHNDLGLLINCNVVLLKDGITRIVNTW